MFDQSEALALPDVPLVQSSIKLEFILAPWKIRYGGVCVPNAFPAPIIVKLGDLSEVTPGGLESLSPTTFGGLCWKVTPFSSIL